MATKEQESILVVEDEMDIAELIKVHMEDLNFNVILCGDGAQAIDVALSQPFSLLILDINLPSVNGLDVCRKIRQAKPAQAILMVTSRISEVDRIVGLELGADDYMTKPFSVRELQARVHALIRRVHLLEKHAIQNKRNQLDTPLSIAVGRLNINQATHQAEIKEQALDLTSKEFDLLLFFARQPDRVFSRAQLLDKIWGYQHEGYEHTVNSHINRLRNKLKRVVEEKEIIQTVFGVGYKFNRDGVEG